MNARSALFDVYGDHLRTRGSAAPIAALVRLLAPLDIGRAGVAQGVRCIPRCTSMLGLVAACQREKPQPCRSKTGSFRVGPRRVARAASTHARSMTAPFG